MGWCICAGVGGHDAAGQQPGQHGGPAPDQLQAAADGRQPMAAADMNVRSLQAPNQRRGAAGAPPTPAGADQNGDQPGNRLAGPAAHAQHGVAQAAQQRAGRDGEAAPARVLVVEDLQLPYVPPGEQAPIVTRLGTYQQSDENVAVPDAVTNGGAAVRDAPARAGHSGARAGAAAAEQRGLAGRKAQAAGGHMLLFDGAGNARSTRVELRSIPAWIELGKLAAGHRFGNMVWLPVQTQEDADTFQPRPLFLEVHCALARHMLDKLPENLQAGACISDAHRPHRCATCSSVLCW